MVRLRVALAAILESLADKVRPVDPGYERAALNDLSSGFAALGEGLRMAKAKRDAEELVKSQPHWVRLEILGSLYEQQVYFKYGTLTPPEIRPWYRRVPTSCQPQPDWLPGFAPR